MMTLILLGECVRERECLEGGRGKQCDWFFIYIYI
jgi:hypothetical protein